MSFIEGNLIKVDNFTRWSFTGPDIVLAPSGDRLDLELSVNQFMKDLDLSDDKLDLAPKITQICFVRVEDGYARPNPRVVKDILKSSNFDLGRLEGLMEDADRIRNSGSPATFWEQVVALGAQKHGPWNPDDVMSASLFLAMDLERTKPKTEMMFSPRDTD